MTDNSTDLTLCAVYSDLPSASIAVGILRSHGIDSITDNATIATVLPPAGGIRLMVRRCDLDRARGILADGGMLD